MPEGRTDLGHLRLIICVTGTVISWTEAALCQEDFII
jgi:hypothetical protein